MEPSLPTVHYLVCLIIPYNYILVLLATGWDFAPGGSWIPRRKNTTREKKYDWCRIFGVGFSRKIRPKNTTSRIFEELGLKKNTTPLVKKYDPPRIPC
jgi:hypothetical protein